MIEFEPWSTNTFKESLENYNHGQFTILDIEVGGDCSLSCVYCDTPDRSTKAEINFASLENFCAQATFKWLFICGLGEPLSEKNYEHFINYLKIAEKYQIKCSIFSNVLNLNDEVLDFVKKGILFVIFKFDSIKKSNIEKIYGTNNAEKIIENIEKLVNLVQINNNQTNLAASIVPTKMNSKDIYDVVDFCYKNKVFPLIGELENCRIPKDLFEFLSVDEQTLLEIKSYISNKYNDEYKIPICPSVISGIHIDNKSNIIVDERTGLSCHWFWLETPKSHTIKQFSNKTIYSEIIDSIKFYRKQKIKEIQNIITNCSKRVFGGCGGNITELLNIYLALETTSKGENNENSI